MQVLETAAAFREARRALDQQVTGGQQADQQPLGEHGAADQPGLEKGLQVLEALLDVRHVVSDSILTRLAAGWMRCCSRSKSRRSPPDPITTISPSTTHLSGRLSLTASTTSGK